MKDNFRIRPTNVLGNIISLNNYPIFANKSVNPSYLFDGIAQQSVKDRLRANTEELIRRGGFGTPTIFVAGTDMYFGNDRLVLVREAVKRTQQKRGAG